MNWVTSISKSIDYIENNITENLTVGEIANSVCISPFYFQKGFAMLSGYTVGEYIRNRRLSIAGNELVSSNIKIIDLSLKYGYESADSFTKAFTRFHNATPSAVKKGSATIKTFAPLKINFVLKGGFLMDFKIVDKPEFKVVGVNKTFKYDGAFNLVPQYWKETMTKFGHTLCGMFGINRDMSLSGNEFDYMIADEYDERKSAVDGIETVTIPAFTWAVFPCIGDCVKTMQETNKKIFSEWLPSNDTYKIAQGYCVEMYSDATKLPKGVNDENYYSELWIPVIKK